MWHSPACMKRRRWGAEGGRAEPAKALNPQTVVVTVSSETSIHMHTVFWTPQTSVMSSAALANGN